MKNGEKRHKEEETPSAEADAEFASLLGQYFPEADVE